MKLFGRRCAALASAVLLIGFVFVLSGCQGNVAIPTTAAVSPLPTQDSTNSRPVSPDPTALATLRPIAFPAQAEPTISNPSSQTSPLPAATRSVGDADGLPLRETRHGNSNSLASTAVPTARIPQAPSGNVALPSFNEAEVYVHTPPQASQRQPLRMLLVLHGMGARGDGFAQSLISEADRNNWVVVAPTLPYRDYMQTTQLMEDDLKISHMLNRLLDSTPNRLNLKLRQHVLMYGFSRGAQLAHRFALIYPERVESVVAMSAGSYTLPSTKSKEQTLLSFPYGIGDLENLMGHPLDWESYKRISFWVAVGERDNQPSDVPRAFDPYLGTTRVERATTFAKSTSALGIDTHLNIFPNTGHEVTPEMRKGALQFLHDDEVADHWND